MPTRDSVVKSARIKIEECKKLDDYLEKEDITFAIWLKEQIETLDVPKQSGVNVDELIRLCDRYNIEPQTLIDGLVRELKRG
jgi:hypothetical protein